MVKSDNVEKNGHIPGKIHLNKDYRRNGKLE